MHLVAMDEGRPGQHLGVSHMLKHYLAPEQLWQDLVTPDDPEHPWRVIDSIGEVEPPPWQQWGANAGPAICALWDDRLRTAYRGGYLRVVRHALTPLQIERGWRRLQDRQWAISTIDGLLVVVRETPAGFRLWTAYRPLEYTRRDYRAVSMDPTALAHRKLVAQSKANRRLLVIAQRGRHD